MFLQILIPVLTFLGICVIFRSIISVPGTGYKKKLKRLLEEEQEANFSRTKEIPGELVIKPGLDFFDSPLFDFDDTDEKHESLKRIKESTIKKGDRYMLRLSENLTNLELKKWFGPGNLEKISIYEGNYYNYLHSLNTFGELLEKNEMKEAAQKVLEHAIFEIKSSVVKSYQMLINIYKENKDSEKLSELKKFIEIEFQDEDLRKKIEGLL